MVTFSRYVVGILFIISGLIKANDPTGFSIKLEEYFVVFGMQWLSFSALSLSVLICALEIVLGVALLFGIRSNSVAWLLLLMIIFFTWLTGYSAITNKVTDCGCFGDAIKLTPWQSFYKDIVLFIFILIIFFKRHSIKSVYNKQTSNAILGGVSIAALGFGIFCVMYLPVVDFLPYKVGNNIPELMEIPEGAAVDSFETKMYYEKDGELKEFNMQNYPWADTTWKWVKTESVLIREGYKPKIKDLRISDDTDNDYSEDIILYPDYQLWIVAYDLKLADKKALQKINILVEALEKNNQIRSIGLTSSSVEQTEFYRHELNTPYPYYYCDATTLKTMVRANPGVLLIKGGVILNKYHFNALPEYEEFVKQLN